MLNNFLESLNFRKVFFTLLTLGLFIYFNALFNNFIWDDYGQILNNPLIHTLNNIPALFKGSTFGNSNAELMGMYYKPIMSVVFTFINVLFQGNPFFFHFFQISLHITNAFLIFYIFALFFTKRLAFFASLIFIVHPINVESVSYISALQEVLFTFFGLLALIFVMRKKKTFFTYFVTFSFLLLSLLSKETGVLFLIITNLYIFLYDKRFLVTNIIYSIIVLLAYSTLRFAIAGVYFNTETFAPIMRASLIERIYSMPSIIFHYISTVIFPKNLIISQHWVITQPTLNNFVLPLIFDLLFLTTIFYLGYRTYHTSRTVFIKFIFFCTWFLIGLGLHLQLFPLDMTVADRWFYFIFIGILGVICSSISAHKFNLNAQKKTLILGFILLIIGILGIRTIIRNTDWKDNQTLYIHDVKINTTSYDLESNAGVAYLQAGQYIQAKYHIERSVKMAPYFHVNWYNLGSVYDKLGNVENAKKYYKKSIDLGNNKAYEDYTIVTFKHGKAIDARKFLLNALKKQPNNASLWLLLAVAEYKIGDFQSSLDAAQKSNKLSPNPRSAYVIYQLSNNLPLEINFE